MSAPVGCGCDGAKCRLTAGDQRHGRAVAYMDHRCRCDACREWKRGSVRRYMSQNRESVRESQARYHAANREKRNAYNRDYYAKACADGSVIKWNDYKAKYRNSPQGKAARRADSRRRREYKRLRYCGCDTRENLAAVWALDAGLCAYCGDPGAEYDHVVPLRPTHASSGDVGGWGCVSNLRIACRRCNSTKSNRPLSYLLERLAASGVEVREGATNSGLPCPAAAARMAARMLPAPPRSVTAA